MAALRTLSNASSPRWQFESFPAIFRMRWHGMGRAKRVKVADQIADQVEQIIADRIAARQIDRDVATSIAADCVATMRPELEPFITRLFQVNKNMISLRPKVRLLAKALPHLTGQSSPEKSPSTSATRRQTGKPARKP